MAKIKLVMRAAVLASVMSTATGLWADCSSGTSCEECTNISWQCKWCPPAQNSTSNGACSLRWENDQCFWGQTTCDSQTCAAQKTCEGCDKLSMCHWCGNETEMEQNNNSNNATGCHPIGSVDGCAVGTACGEESTCAEQTNCTACYNTSSFCHWCGDSCHTIGSIFGCTVGVQCMANSQCIRNQPEYIGHNSPPGWLEFLLFWFVLVNVSLAALFIVLCKRLKVFFNQAAQLDDTVELREPTGDDARPGDPPAPSPANTIRARSRELDLVILFDPVFHVLYKCTFWCCGLLVFCAVATSLFALTFSPAAPVANFCNGELDWKSIILSLANGLQTIDADYEMLMSLYNPNRLDIDIHSFSGEFFYKTMAGSDQSVARVHLTPYLIPSGSVADKIAVLSIGVDRWSALELGALYWEGKLMLYGDIDVSFQLRFWNSPLFWPLSVNLKHLPINVTQPKHGRRYCNCKADQNASAHVLFGGRYAMIPDDPKFNVTGLREEMLMIEDRREFLARDDDSGGEFDVVQEDVEFIM